MLFPQYSRMMGNREVSRCSYKDQIFKEDNNIQGLHIEDTNRQYQDGLGGAQGFHLQQSHQQTHHLNYICIL